MKKKASLDFYRLLASFFVVAIHTSPFYSINPAFDFFLFENIIKSSSPSFSYDNWVFCNTEGSKR